MEETFQSNTLDWSSLVIIIFVFLSSASPDISVHFNAIAFIFGLSIVFDRKNRSFNFQVNRTRGRDKAWSQSFTMLYNRKNSILLCVEIRISLSEENFNEE